MYLYVKYIFTRSFSTSSDSAAGAPEGPVHPPAAGGGAPVPAPPGVQEAPQRAREGGHQEHRHRRPHQERAHGAQARECHLITLYLLLLIYCDLWQSWFRLGSCKFKNCKLFNGFE